MIELVPFQFEDKQLRVLGTPEAPLFHVNDLCAVLEYADPHKAVTTHVPEDDRVKRPVIDSLGRTQQANYVTEAGMWALVMRANTEAAKRVQRWVTHEVLPALRKTGRYEVPARQAKPQRFRPAEIYKLGQMIAKDYAKQGVKEDIINAMILELVKVNTGADMEPVRQAIPGRTEVTKWLNATQVGELIGVGARKINSILETAGLQVRSDDGVWRLTEKGQQFGEAKPFTRNGHSGLQIQWKPDVVTALSA